MGAFGKRGACRHRSILAQNIMTASLSYISINATWYETYPAPHRPTIEDLDPESATTDRLIAMVRSHRQGEEYPTAETLLANLPIVLRALCDHVLTGQASALDVAYRLASIIDALEGRDRLPELSRRTH